MSGQPAVTAVVLNYNGWAQTARCLESLRRSAWPLRTVVIDNGSASDPAPQIAARFPEVVYLRLDRNLGFAGGMNAGIGRALELGCDYVLLLNNDTLVDPAMVGELVSAAAERPDAGIVSPLVLDESDPDLVLSAGWHFDPRRGHPGRPLLSGTRIDSASTEIREVIASSGEAMLVSAEAIAAVALLDEDYFLRLEDIDYSLRMRAGGRRNYVVLGARLWHSVSASSGGEHSPLNAYYHTRNMFLICDRHAPLHGVRQLLRASEIVVANLAHSLRGRRPARNARAVLEGWRDYRKGRVGVRG